MASSSAMPRWHEIAIEVPAAAADALSNWLVERGAPGIIEEPLADERLRLRAHFDDATPAEALIAETLAFLAELDSFFPGSGAAAPTVATIDAEDWAEGWKRGFPPLEVGRSLRVRPPWSEIGSPARHDVVIEPAMAFGTGHHASTLGCLLAMETIFEVEREIPAVLDVGTGSGILAIAAARLGARRVLAIDTDPIAVEAAAANVERNRLGEAIELRCGTLDSASGRYGLIVANLYSGLLAALFPGFANRAERGGRLVTAGLLDADRGVVSDAGAASGWREVESRSLDGWTTLTFRRED